MKTKTVVWGREKANQSSMLWTEPLAGAPRQEHTVKIFTTPPKS